MNKAEVDNLMQEKLQKIYDDNFSFVGFDKFFLANQLQFEFVTKHTESTYAAFNYKELQMVRAKEGCGIKHLMKVRLIDALCFIKNNVDEKIKQLEEIK